MSVTATRLPARTDAQRMSALRNANAIRTKRAELKRKLKTRRADPRDVIALAGDNVPPHLATMQVMDVLLSTPKIGRVKADKILRTAKTSPSKTLGGLTHRQRSELLALMPRT